MPLSFYVHNWLETGALWLQFVGLGTVIYWAIKLWKKGF